MPRVLILGAGVAGTLAANRLRRARRDLEIVVVSGYPDHLYQPGFLRVPFGASADPLRRDEAGLLRAGVEFRVDHVAGVQPDRRQIGLASGGVLGYDWLVIATGSRLDSRRIPGAREHLHHFHCLKGALRLADRLSQFRGGRIVVGASRLPYKCPPSTLEFAFLLDAWLRRNGLRSKTRLTFVHPRPALSPVPEVASWAESELRDRGCEIVAGFEPEAVDASTRTMRSRSLFLPFDLGILVPPHIGAPFLKSSGLADAEGWVAVDPRTLRACHRVYALGDAAKLPCPKSGSAAAFQARIVAENILAELDGRAPGSRYDGRAICSLETGSGRAAFVESAYETSPRAPSPSWSGYWKKRIFGKLYFPMMRRA